MLASEGPKHALKFRQCSVFKLLDLNILQLLLYFAFAIYCNACLHLQFIAMLACICYVHDYVSRYLLLALNFFVHLLTWPFS